MRKRLTLIVPAEKTVGLAARVTLSLLALTNLLLPGSAQADSSVLPSPTPPSVQSSGQTFSTAKQLNNGMQSIWEMAYKVEGLAGDLLNEGKYWQPNNNWLDVHTTSLAQLVNALQSEIQSVQAASFSDQPQLSQMLQQMLVSSTQLGTDLKDVQTGVAKVDEVLQAKKYPSYPLAFWKPSASIVKSAKQIEDQVMQVYKLNGGASQQHVPISATSTTGALQANVSDAQPSSITLQGSARKLSSRVGLQAIDQTLKGIEDVTNGAIGELERWNLFFGSPSAQQYNPSYPYGGGLSPQEIEGQFRYMTTFAFTMPAYTRFSYRMPPRHAMLVYYTTRLGKLLNMLNGEIRDLEIPAQSQVALAGPMDALNNLYQDSAQNYLQLLNLVNSTSDAQLKKAIHEDQLDFGRPVVAIHDDVEKMQSLLSSLKQQISDNNAPASGT